MRYSTARTSRVGSAGRASHTKTLLDLDESLLAEAQDALQTSTKKDTVTAALREVLESRRRAAAVLAEMSRAKSGGYEFLVSDENDAWR